MSPDEYFDDIVDELAPEGVHTAKLFGSRALKLDSKVFAVVHSDDMVFRLGAGTRAHTDALGLAGAELFDPSGKQRPLKDWVAVPADHSGQWSLFAEAALAHLRQELRARR
ncbi:TfoX/Sxy family protein [Cryptosporangium aurantiacum]|uniref:TfoX N-terminal domain-containing protein n=1 Tax=Cryptosporangium aurantiacum TaxID=134849 RepID=A0A1M7RL35_9ACTN|nr:TfoX/Sxy family protein [Cryptosporangium aurantiacum]SHN47055.1 TfoX N-terminal domain-containing protein [Cryptosporangium aurantiacum]